MALMGGNKRRKKVTYTPRCIQAKDMVVSIHP
jgi:hypothetical protein